MSVTPVVSNEKRISIFSLSSPSAREHGPTNDLPLRSDSFVGSVKDVFSE